MTDDMEYEDRTRQARLELDIRIRSVLDALTRSQDGIIFLRWLMSECRVFEQEYTSDPTRTTWNAGRRAFGLQVLSHCAAIGKADILLAKEQS